MKLKEFARLFLRRTKRDPSPKGITTILDDGYELLRDLPYEVAPSLLYSLPPRYLVMQGGSNYGPDHPFIAAITHGQEALTSFYDGCQPTDIAEMYGIAKFGKLGETLPPWDLPWLKRERRPPSAEAGLPASEGVSYYGPCSAEKVLTEYRRLMSLVASISRHGYHPEVFGHIEGHFLRFGDRYRFFVRGGKHRAAVLAYLGRDTIPVRVRPTWPRVITDDTIHDWPLVRSGELSIEIAQQILERYFNEA